MKLAYCTYRVFIIVYVVGMNNTLAREGQERNKLRAYLRNLFEKYYALLHERIPNLGNVCF
jgi:hypothetical protein